MRSHYCGQVNRALIGRELSVAGWVHRRRDHGGVIFIDLRDREGLLQIVFDPDDKAMFAEAERLRGEYVLAVDGRLRARPEGTINPNLASGEVELLATKLTVLNKSKTPPFHHDEPVSEELRLRYRYLDLRRVEMMSHLRLRHRVTRALSAGDASSSNRRRRRVERPMPLASWGRAGRVSRRNSTASNSVSAYARRLEFCAPTTTASQQCSCAVRSS